MTSNETVSEYVLQYVDISLQEEALKLRSKEVGFMTWPQTNAAAGSGTKRQE